MEQNNLKYVYLQPHKVQYYETDGMRIVHHSNYIRWFEEARVGWLDEIGFGYEKLEQNGISSPVIGINCDYHAPAVFGDTVLLRAELVKLTPVRFEFAYEVRDEKTGTLCASGTTRHCFTDSSTGRPVRLNRALPAVYDLMASAMQG